MLTNHSFLVCVNCIEPMIKNFFFLIFTALVHLLQNNLNCCSMVRSASHTEAQVQTCLTFQQLHDKSWNKNAIKVVFSETNLKMKNTSSQSFELCSF